MMSCFSVISRLKLRRFFEKIRMAFEEITPQSLRFWQSDESSKEYWQRISRQHCCSLTFLRHSIPYREKRWNRYFNHYNDALWKHESNGLLTWWRNQLLHHSCWSLIRRYIGSAYGVMVIIIGNGHDDSSSNPRQDWLHFT